MIRLVLLDIEGTLAPVSFVHTVLFPFARARLPALLHDHAARPDVAAALAEVAALAPGQPPLQALLGWMDRDAKTPPLKALQGLIWQDGYESGALRSEFYPDVAAALRAWAARGVSLAIYSSGSVQAQHLLFQHSTDGDLRPLIGAWFDTRIGSKRDPASYRAIATQTEVPIEAMLFVSDLPAELNAARMAGSQTIQMVRTEDGTRADPSHRGVTELADVITWLGSVTPD